MSIRCQAPELFVWVWEPKNTTPVDLIVDGLSYNGASPWMGLQSKHAQ
jgi:hypothetical protein